MSGRTITAAVLLAVATVLSSGPAAAQKSGGTLRLYIPTNPPSASIHEELTVATVAPFMAVFNNLVLFDQTKPRNSMDSIVPDLAESWAWDASRTRLTFKLRQGVKWHDGKPFTAKDVQCTWQRLIGEDYFGKNPRRVWYTNLKEVTVDGEHQATFHLSKPQPALIALLASGMGPVYPCHQGGQGHAPQPGRHRAVQVRGVQVPRLDQAGAQPRLLEAGAALSRRHRVAHRFQSRNPHPGLCRRRGRLHVPRRRVCRPLQSRSSCRPPKRSASCTPANVTTNLLVNRDAAPFSDPKIRRAMMLALDRQGFNDIIHEGKALISGAMLPPPVR